LGPSLFALQFGSSSIASATANLRFSKTIICRAPPAGPPFIPAKASRKQIFVRPCVSGGELKERPALPWQHANAAMRAFSGYPDLRGSSAEKLIFDGASSFRREGFTEQIAFQFSPKSFSLVGEPGLDKPGLFAT